VPCLKTIVPFNGSVNNNDGFQANRAVAKLNLKENDDADKSQHCTSPGHTFAESDWLDVHFLAMQSEYEEMLRWVGIQPGWHVLDAAYGSFLPLMTELVGPSGKISAMDLAPENIAINPT
jgi:hypothetical protein